MTSTHLRVRAAAAPRRPARSGAGVAVAGIAAAWPALFLAASSLATGGRPRPAVLAALAVSTFLPAVLIAAALVAPAGWRWARAACSRAARRVAAARHARRYT